MLCLKKGDNLFPYTLASTKTECWCNGGFELVASIAGKEWESKYWHKMNASMKSAQRLGWKFVEIEIVEKSVPVKRKVKG